MPLGLPKFLPSWGDRPVDVRSSAPGGTQRKTLGGKGIIGAGKHGMGGKGLGKGGLKRHRYVRALSILKPRPRALPSPQGRTYGLDCGLDGW